MTRCGIFVNGDGSTEAWEGDNYVALGSMRAEPARSTDADFPPAPRLYMVIEEYPAVTIAEFANIAEDQRAQRRRKKQLRRLLRRAAELASLKPGAEQ